MTPAEIFRDCERFERFCRREITAGTPQQAANWRLLADCVAYRLRAAHAVCPGLFDLGLLELPDLYADMQAQPIVGRS